ncbi:glycosyltransferase family 4 protein [Winogradskyella pacifica]|uniref:glycosyltransferase family 4 protein n=1 Tax=Winogradskyella pacifica TaxID=664642 RepID=UPI0015CAF1DA|nr:glycosyltransferase family 4 protein [Winogradskyella pacifica]
MKKLGYITNTGLDESSGGGSGVNFATYNNLKNNFTIKYIKINANSDFLSKIKSGFLKKLNLKRNYHFFSNQRLRMISNLFNGEQNNVDFYFFHGFTQWIDIIPNKPYFCFNDACFATYVEIYNNKNEFCKKDLNRIYKKEANWLNNAAKVFFRSEWALNEAKEKYNLLGENFINVGVGGFIDIPKKDNYEEGFNFLFISREFIPKGGETVVSAIKALRQEKYDVTLWIVGEKPNDDILSTEGVEYLGFFNKNIKEERLALIKIFEQAFALVHPTLKDVNPLVVNELAYFGCPAIASNKFAIPEYLLNNKTGFLINNPRDFKEFKILMANMVNDPDMYLAMRKKTRQNAIDNNTWDIVGSRIVQQMEV